MSDNLSFLSVYASHREWRSWRLPARTWKWEGNMPPSVLMLPTTQNLRSMGKYPPSQRRRHISNRPPDRPTELPAVFTRSPVNENYSKQQHCPPLHETGNEKKKKWLGVLFLFCKKKKRKKEKLSYDDVVCFCFAQTLITRLLFSVNVVTKAAVSFFSNH